MNVVIFKPLVPTPIQSTPRLGLFSNTCLLLISARVVIGDRPEFSANDNGIFSKASAKLLTAYCSKVDI